MRIQHNIPAMNAYRNYNSNTKALQANLQKLSSGYKINKAGDDAAGLAISEKMRAQISGLEMAQKNAKDGISLVQTAEGAMTEIHTMLNRMFSLAEQSANGTYEDAVDREQLNNEFQKLTTEIDRIADSTNFNGKKLLDGTLDGGASGASNSQLTVSNAAGSLNPVAADATKGKYTVGGLTGTVANGDIVELNFTLTDANGKEENVSAQMKVDGTNLKTLDGKTTLKSGLNSGTGLAAGEVADAFIALVGADKELAAKFADFDITKATNDIQFAAKKEGAATKQITAASMTNTTTTANAITSSLKVEKGQDSFQTLNLVGSTVWDMDVDKLKDSIIEVNGEKFVFLQNGKTLDDAANKALAEAGVGSNVVTIANAGAATTVAAADVKAMAAMITQETGLETTLGTLTGTTWADSATGTVIGFKQVTATDDADAGAGAAAGDGKGLRLRVGDSTNDYDDIYVQIKSLNKDKLEGTIKEGKGAGETYTLDKLDVLTDGAADIAMGALKDMINYVSTERGNLGATQNRLDHTINNLSTMQENIQDAEATIRDVDVAEEMMKYTKNNILVQSAQAMLAQANQLPQGVLQLLG